MDTKSQTFRPFVQERDSMGRLINSRLEKSRIRRNKAKKKVVKKSRNVNIIYNQYSFPIFELRDDIEMYPGESKNALNKLHLLSGKILTDTGNQSPKSERRFEFNLKDKEGIFRFLDPGKLSVPVCREKAKSKDLDAIKTVQARLIQNNRHALFWEARTSALKSNSKHISSSKIISRMGELSIERLDSAIRPRIKIPVFPPIELNEPSNVKGGGFRAPYSAYSFSNLSPK